MQDLTHSSLPHPALHYACAGIAYVVARPWRIPSVITPRSVGLPYRTVSIDSGEVRLAAWHVPCEGSRAGIVLCHGHDDCRMQFLHMLRPLHEAGLHLLLFDSRSMGLSGGRYCSYGYHEQEDALAALGWLRQETGVERLGLYGISMGGATALLAAASAPEVRAVVTDSAFARLADMVERRFLILPPRARAPVGNSVRHWVERWTGASVDQVDPEAAVRGWEPRPLLVIHGERDLLVPVEHAHRLAAAAGETCELWTVPRAQHVRCRVRARAQYPARISAFFRRHLL